MWLCIDDLIYYIRNNPGLKGVGYNQVKIALGTSYNAPVKEKVEKIKTMVFSLLK